MRLINLDNTIFDNASYVEHEGRWVVWNNSSDIAEQIKRIYPDQPVFLFDKTTGNYTRYTITYIHQKPHMKKGKLVYEEETIEI